MHYIVCPRIGIELPLALSGMIYYITVKQPSRRIYFPALIYIWQVEMLYGT